MPLRNRQYPPRRARVRRIHLSRSQLRSHHILPSNLNRRLLRVDDNRSQTFTD